MFDRVTCNPLVMGGRACIRGYRVTVSQIVMLVASSMTVEHITVECPGLEAEDVRQVLQYAATRAAEQGSGGWGSALAYLESASVNGPFDWSERWEFYTADQGRTS
jgi:uncharacterized protein (DUF433 family)